MNEEENYLENYSKLQNLMIGIIFGQLTESDKNFYTKISQNLSLLHAGKILYSTNNIDNFNFWNNKILPISMEENFSDLVFLKNTIIYENKKDINVYKQERKYVFFPKIKILNEINLGNYSFFYVDFDFDIELNVKDSNDPEGSWYFYSDENTNYIYCSDDFYNENECEKFHYSTFVRLTDYHAHAKIIERYNPEYLSIIPQSYIVEMFEKFSYNKDSKIIDFLCKKLFDINIKKIDDFFRSKGIKVCEKIHKPIDAIETWKLQNTLATKKCCPKSIIYTTNYYVVINESLSKGEITPYFSVVIDDMMKAFENNIYPPAGTYIFRGLSLDENDNFISKNKKFSSFSLDLGIALNFSENADKSIILYYKIPEKFNCIYLDKHYGTSVFYGEKELLIPPNKEFIIKNSFNISNITFNEIDIVDIDIDKCKINSKLEDKYDLAKIKNCYIIIRQKSVEIVFNIVKKMKKYFEKFKLINNIYVSQKIFSEPYGITYEDYFVLYSDLVEVYPVDEETLETFTGDSAEQFICHMLR